jgi:hypothetical protein
MARSKRRSGAAVKTSLSMLVIATIAGFRV